MVKRSKAVKARHHEVITHRILTGVKYTEITKELKICNDTLYRDIQELKEQWKKQAQVNMDEIRSEELKKIQLLEHESWQAWKDSKGETIREEEGENEKNGKWVKTVKIILNGDPRFLDIILKCMDRRAKMYGLDEPVAPPDQNNILNMQINIRSPEEFKQLNDELDDAWVSIKAPGGNGSGNGQGQMGTGQTP